MCKAAEKSQNDGKYSAIFFSMDIRRDQDNANAFKPLLNKYKKWDCHSKYDGKYFLSTFNGGYTTNTYPSSFFQSLNQKRNQIYFVPDLDDPNGYCGSDTNRGKTVDGLFTWACPCGPSSRRC